MWNFVPQQHLSNDSGTLLIEFSGLYARLNYRIANIAQLRWQGFGEPHILVYSQENKIMPHCESSVKNWWTKWTACALKIVFKEQRPLLHVFHTNIKDYNEYLLQISLTSAACVGWLSWLTRRTSGGSCESPLRTTGSTFSRFYAEADLIANAPVCLHCPSLNENIRLRLSDHRKTSRSRRHSWSPTVPVYYLSPALEVKQQSKTRKPTF